MTDETLKYNGRDIEFAFKANGEQLAYGDDYVVSWKGAQPTRASNTLTVVHAGDYVATLEGQNDYEGKTKDITVHVDPIGLSADVVPIDAVATADGIHRCPELLRLD